MAPPNTKSTIDDDDDDDDDDYGTRQNFPLTLTFILGCSIAAGCVSELIGYPSSGLTFECTDVGTAGLCDTAVRDVRLLVC